VTGDRECLRRIPELPTTECSLVAGIAATDLRATTW
jgi:hypothetical protein